ncbi:hypothetical protein D3C79_856820 [compost metagenome]
MTVKHGYADAATDQRVGARQPGRPGTNNRHAFIHRLHAAQIRSPAFRQRLVGDIALNVTDGHRTGDVAHRAGPFAQLVLRADPAGDFRQTVSLMRELDGGVDVARQHQLNPLGNRVMQRAGPFTH